MGGSVIEVSTQRQFSEYTKKSNLTVVDFFATCRFNGMKS